MDYRHSKTTLADRLDNYAALAKTSSRIQGWSAHLNRWPIYAAATGAALALTTSADASTIVTGFSGEIAAATALRSTYQEGSATVRLGPSVNNYGFGLRFQFSQYSSGGAGSTANYTSGRVKVVRPVSGSPGTLKFATTSGYLRRFSAGAAIGNSASFTTSGLVWKGQRSTYTGNLQGNSGTGQFNRSGYAGFQLSNGDFGWIKLEWLPATAGSDAPYGIEALAWGIETDGSSINAGATSAPEPGTLPLSLLALGAVGIVAWRKRRSQTA